MTRIGPAIFLGLSLSACGDPKEAPRVELPVVVDASGITTVENDLGYEVTLTEARVMMENLAFTVAGEAHTASLWDRVSEFAIPSAYAHPGHFLDGDVTGELRGRFELDWTGGEDTTLGTATLIVGAYKSANFTFIRATADDGLASDDPLLGHTAVLRGTATKDATTLEFTVIIDSPEGRDLVGAPFELHVTEGASIQLGVRLLTLDPFESDTLFDGIDFAALSPDNQGPLLIDPSATEQPLIDAYNLIRRTFQTHDHFDVRPFLPG